MPTVGQNVFQLRITKLNGYTTEMAHFWPYVDKAIFVSSSETQLLYLLKKRHGLPIVPRHNSV